MKKVGRSGDREGKRGRGGTPVGEAVGDRT